MQKTFSQAFIEHLEQSDLKVTEIAIRAGVSKDALYSLKYGKSQNMAVDDAIRVAAVFGKKVEEFLGLSEAQIRSTLAEKVARLSSREQAILEASLDAILSDIYDHQVAEARDAIEEEEPG
ncbi:MAG TPA: hypothetical protein ENH56_16345 [Roseobacter sp.]|uniref:HTH cro/C1-type domain-containing protein n=1 Tax=marine sediment metagenome TaxID=412755 RepID=A0A0F9T4H4_9ZZZZ|nr:hypothetical protein [Roseobacter sp.]